ncbi:hypothetical protein QBC35DRAFT_455379 [Podospora australis]|uniref:Uncharacterized protein n=1 Tax=Podospora australis TaxID=1536484 RepID=A0AAN6WLY0_9PEZI|nr:hypothetical protein QBC35DRAFT_455379 [Podospora australis]
MKRAVKAARETATVELHELADKAANEARATGISFRKTLISAHDWKGARCEEFKDDPVAQSLKKQKIVKKETSKAGRTSTRLGEDALRKPTSVAHPLPHKITVRIFSDSHNVTEATPKRGSLTAFNFTPDLEHVLALLIEQSHALTGHFVDLEVELTVEWIPSHLDKDKRWMPAMGGSPVVLAKPRADPFITIEPAMDALVTGGMAIAEAFPSLNPTLTTADSPTSRRTSTIPSTMSSGLSGRRTISEGCYQRQSQHQQGGSDSLNVLETVAGIRRLLYSVHSPTFSIVPTTINRQSQRLVGSRSKHA